MIFHDNRHRRTSTSHWWIENYKSVAIAKERDTKEKLGQEWENKQYELEDPNAAGNESIMVKEILFAFTALGTFLEMFCGPFCKLKDYRCYASQFEDLCECIVRLFMQI